MTEKILGKITSAEIGCVPDYPFLFGLILDFSLSSNGGIGSGSTYTINVSKNCNWNEGPLTRDYAITRLIDKINSILHDAKVLYISELIGKPVEVSIENGRFDSFRILTEVL